MTNDKDSAPNPLDISQLIGVLKRKFWLILMFGIIGVGMAFALKSRVTESYTTEIYLESKVTSGKMMAKAINHMSSDESDHVRSIKAESLGSNVVAVRLSLMDSSGAQAAIQDLNKYLNSIPSFAKELEMIKAPLEAKRTLYEERLERIKAQMENMNEKRSAADPVIQMIDHDNRRDKIKVEEELINIEADLREVGVFKSLDLSSVPQVKIQRPSTAKRYISYVGFMLVIGYVVAFALDSRRS